VATRGSAPGPERRKKEAADAQAVAADLLNALDPRRRGSGRLPETDRNLLAGAAREALQEDPVALNALQLWMAGDITQQAVVQKSLAGRLAQEQKLVEELRTVIDRLSQREGLDVTRSVDEEQRQAQPELRERERTQTWEEEPARRAEWEQAQREEQMREVQREEQEGRDRERDPAPRVPDLYRRHWRTGEPLPAPPMAAPNRPNAGRLPAGVRIRRSAGRLSARVGGWAGLTADGVDVMRRRLRPTRPDKDSPTRLVSTGIARADGTVLSSRWTLAPDTPYLYWFSIGRTPAHNRVDTGPDQALPRRADLRPGTQLRVVVFAFDDELVIDPDQDAGMVELDIDGGANVARPVIADDAGVDRLAFPVRTASVIGVQRLRCNIYHETRLLQSRVLRTVVGKIEAPTRRRSTTSVTDYTVASNLDIASLGRPPRLSLLANHGSPETHLFRFYGENEIKGEASIDAEALEALFEPIRKAMRIASWQTEKEWTKDNSYRYDPPVPPERLEADLIRMARRGRQLWDTLASELGRGLSGQAIPDIDPAIVMRGLMRTPGTFEYACPETYRLAMPTALLYDSPLDSQMDLSYCPTARQSLRRPGTTLLEEPCFSGNCPSYDDKLVMCPSGFWGYRHAIGLPVSLPTDGTGPRDAAQVISGAAAPTIAAALTTDPAFTQMADHVKRLAALHNPEEWIAEVERDKVIALLQRTEPHVVYFLCHGGETDGLPGLLVGDPSAETPIYITPDNFTEYGIRWPKTRPLVLLNGCRTTALDPNRPQNFVDLFIRRMFASAVIGTEITIFEPLAVRFAEQMLEAFVVGDMPLGEAVRHARLELLREGNPLGLVYIPYGPVGLCMA